ncbi:MAG: AAA family ATPase, partial [Candidatus Marinimicrobia bacterium]|nr:AAA family ATPase [Candidatus Neomarinimicrobiota bacterium]
MYISKITLNNIRCFTNETIELGDSHPSLLIAGNNATGKTSLLRSIAMGLCDEASAGGLLRELPGDFIRTGEDNASITIEFTEEDGEKWFILTELELYKKLNFERVLQRYYKNEVKKDEDGENWKDFPWEKLFIAGYGDGLRTEGTADYDEYFSGD